jgi:hypothetical protein
MKREESLLNLLCVVVAAGFFVLIAYNFFAGGSIISTDGLFFTVVPMVLALCFLMVPAMGALSARMQRRALATDGSPPRLAPAVGATWVPGARTVPALKDARGRSMPPDVNRMVAEMNAPRKKES